jgi:hypothetical protein
VPDPELRLCLEESIGKTFGTAAGSITLADLEGAERLDTKQRPIASLKGLELAKGLKRIDGYNSGIADASALRGLPLVFCGFDGNLISSLDPFLLSPSLEFLGLIDNPISAAELRKITPASFPSLVGLEISSDADGTGDHYLSARTP